MEEAYNNTLSTLLYAPGARNWYEDLNITVKTLPKKVIPNFPVIPNKLPLLPSGEIANVSPPPEVSILPETEEQNQEEPIADDFELSDDEEMECEETVICNSEPSVQPIIYLDSCGREVEHSREIMQPEMSSDEEETDEQKFEVENTSSAHPEPPIQDVEDSSDDEIVQRKGQVKNPSPKITKWQALVNRIDRRDRLIKNSSSMLKNFQTPPDLIDRRNGQLKIPSSIINKRQSNDKVDRRKGRMRIVSPIINSTEVEQQNEHIKNTLSFLNQRQTIADRRNGQIKNNSAIYCKGRPPKKCLTSDEETEHQNAQVKNTSIPRKCLTARKRQSSDLKIDHHNELVKYTHFKRPVEQPEISSDDDEIAHQNGRGKTSFLVRSESPNGLCDTSSSDDDEQSIIICHDEDEQPETRSESDSSHDEEESQENYPNSMDEGYPRISIQEMSPDPSSSSDDEDSSDDDEVLFPDHKSMEIKEKGDFIVIYINVGDFQLEEVAVDVEGDVLTVQGVKTGDSLDSYLLTSQFYREYRIPDTVDIDDVDHFHILPGVIKIFCPKIIVSSTTMDDDFY